MNAIQAFVPPEIVKTFAAFLEFYYIAHRNIITDDSLNQLNVALCKFHESRRVFLGTVQEDGPSGFSLPRQHSMVHYHDHIKNFGSPNGLCSSITESKHIAAVKRPWRRSNKHAALSQMLKVNERLDKLAAARADFTTRGMLTDSCIIHAIRNMSSIVDYDSEDPMDEDESDSDESDNDISDVFNANPADIQDLNNITFEFDNEANPHGLTNTNTSIPNSSDVGTLNDTNTQISDIDNDHPHTPRHRSPTPPNENDDDDDDHGPVESGPLMNEVRLVSKKGEKHPPRVTYKL